MLLTEDVRKILRIAGRMGGRKRARTCTPERLSEIGRMGGIASRKARRRRAAENKAE